MIQKSEERPERTRLRELSGDELKAAAKERADRMKIDPEKLAARREERRSARAAVRLSEPAQRKRTVRLSIGLGVALLVVAGACVTATDMMSSQTVSNQAANARQIKELQAHVSYLDEIGGKTADGSGGVGSKQADPVQAAKDASAQLDTVRKKADEVASLQNEFAALLLEHPEDPGNGASSQGFLDAVKHRETLSPYFSKGTYLLDDGTIASPGSNLGLDEGKIDPRLQWYERKQGAGDFSWAAMSAVPSESGSPSLTDVTWLCQDTKTGELLAWATSSWSKDAKAFVSLTVGTTSLGDQQNANAIAQSLPDASSRKGGA